MAKIIFIISLILIFETSFRLWKGGPDEPEYAFYIFHQEETDSVRWYVYHIFEHVKVLLLCIGLTIVFSRCSFLICMFSIDLITFLLNYYSTWYYVYGIPIGTDLLKLFILVPVIVREALDYYNGLYPYNNERRRLNAYAYGNVLAALRSDAYQGMVSFVEKILSGNLNRSKT